MQDPDCIFCRIVRGEIPSRKVHEDDEVLAFHDIHPLAPVHFLIIPKDHIASMMDLQDGQRELFGKIMVLAPELARELTANRGNIKLGFGRKNSIDTALVRQEMQRLLPDMTFLEAYRKTGRSINITISPAGPRQTSRLLNHIAHNLRTTGHGLPQQKVVERVAAQPVGCIRDLPAFGPRAEIQNRPLNWGGVQGDEAIPEIQ